MATPTAVPSDDTARHFSVVAGSGNRQLAESIARHLGTPLMLCDVTQFTNGETRVKLNESARGRPVTIICSPRPGHINDDLMEVLVLADTLRRSRYAIV
jgi:ribose-phosphate pyrophosphokinase